MSVESVGKSARSIQNSPNCAFSLSSINRKYDKHQQKPQTTPNVFRRANTNKVRSASRVLFKENDHSRVSSQEKVKKSTTLLFSTVLTENNLIHNLTTDVSHYGHHNALHLTSDSLSQLGISPRSSESPSQGTGKSFLKLKSSPIRSLITTYDQVVSLDFDSAFHRFKTLKHDVLAKKLWKLSFMKKLRRCWTHSRLEDENLDGAEKLIKFAFTKFNTNDFFHLSLLKSAEEIIQTLTNRPSFGIRIKKIDCKYPLMSFLTLLFFHDFFRSQLESFIEKFDSVRKAVKVLFWISDAAIIALRKEKLNRVINHCGKCFEAYCFFFAGLVIQTRESGGKVLGCSRRKQFYKKVLKNVNGSVFETVKLAEELYE